MSTFDLFQILCISVIYTQNIFFCNIGNYTNINRLFSLISKLISFEFSQNQITDYLRNH